MLDHLKLTTAKRTPMEKKNWVREYLQARILQGLMERKRFVSWIFHGGTALRFLFALPRYSEDLDFSLLAGADAEFEDNVEAVVRGLIAEGYEVGVKYSGKMPVRGAFFRFDGLLHALGISPHPHEHLSVKIELDTQAPEGGKTQTTLIRRHILLNLHHYDRPTLLAGKLNAILTRTYFKGRDLYDLLWYLADPDWPAPNLNYLNHALCQAGTKFQHLNASSWPEAVRLRLAECDWKTAVNDVMPFIENQQEIALLTPKNLEALLRSRIT